MFQKKQYIYSETLGVCKIENIVRLTTRGAESIPYYVLRPVFDKEKVSYIPVENHQVMLRELFSEDEARKLKQDPKLEKDKQLKEAVDFVLQNAEEHRRK